MSHSLEACRITGSCLCGKVQYAAVGPFPTFRYCHCERCQKFTGSAHSANVWVPKERFQWTAGESEKVTFVHGEAEDYVRCFCKICGGPVPKLGRDGKHMLMPGGTLDTDPGVRPSASIFWKYHAPWYVPTPELPTFEERPG